MPPPPADELNFKPLDGGWGWIVVVGAHICIGFAYSIPKAFSVFFHDIQEDLGVTSSEIAWVTSIMQAFTYGGGLMSSVMVSRFGSRPVAMLGGVICGASMAGASQGTSIILLYLCAAIAGFGLALNLNASLTIISKYFLIKRPLANGLAMAGSPVFLCVLAPVNEYLLQNYSWRGSLLILGGAMLNCCVGGALMRPVVPPNKPSTGAPENKVEEQPNKCKTELKDSCVNSAKMFLDLSFFKDRGFIIYIIGSMLFMFGTYGPVVFLQSFAIDLGVEEYSAAFLISIMSFADMIARPCTGLIANSKWIRPRIQYFFSFAMVLNGTCHLLCPLSTNYAMLVTYTIFFGMSIGMVFAVIFECLMDLVGNERFPSAVGLVTIIQCLPILLGPPAAGLLVDIYGEYDYLYFMCGTVIASAGLFLFVMNGYNYYILEKQNPSKNREQNPNDTENQDPVKVSEVEMEPIPKGSDGTN